MAETLILDPSAVADDRFEFDITAFVEKAGPDYGNAEIQQYLADLEYGSVPVDFRVPNRTVQIPLVLHETGALTFDEVRTYFQAKAARFQAEGGWLARETSVGTVYADVMSASLKLGGSSVQAFGLVDADAVLTLECLPDWYQDEVSASPAHSETTLPELVWTETGIEGNYPARCRWVVTDLSGQSQYGLLYGLRSRYYSSASTARLAYEAEAMTPVSPAAIATRSGASGGASNNVVAHTNLAALGATPYTWTDVLGTNISGSRLTHTGTYRVWARVYSADEAAVQARLIWNVGPLNTANLVENPPARLADWGTPLSTDFWYVDLGEVHIAQSPAGTHGWEGRIQAAGDAGGEDIEIDRVFFQPVGESAGKLGGNSNPVVRGSKSAELRTEGIFSESTVAGMYSPITPIGDLPRLPVAGLENRTLEVFLLPSRNDFESVNRAMGIDDSRGQMFYRPCWLFVPDDLTS